MASPEAIIYTMPQGGNPMSMPYEISDAHRAALKWFESNSGRTFDYKPFDVGIGINLTQRQMGIWKPAGTKYALSVVQTSRGIYEDMDLITDDVEHSWTYFYHQQGHGIEAMKLYTNVGLMNCKDDGVPVGVVVPAASGRGYKVLGLAIVVDYLPNDGLFHLVGPVTSDANPAALVQDGGVAYTSALIDLREIPFDPNGALDDRIKVLREVTARRGGQKFRRALLQVYEGHCAMTGYDAQDALEAAHIVPYKGPQTNHPANGLLLRADMHTLFDLGMVAVETSEMKILLSKELEGTKYEPYHERKLWLPSDKRAYPSIDALDKQREGSRVA